VSVGESSAAQEPGRPSVARPLLLIAGAVVGVLLVAAVVFVLATREQPAFPADTPAGTFQRYLAAFDDGDYETAYAYFSAPVQGMVPYRRYERTARDFSTWNGGRQHLTLDDVRLAGERATLGLIVREGGGPFDGGWEDRQSISLVREQEQWRIDQPLLRIYPMSRYDWDY
jgi:hypothetical protein